MNKFLKKYADSYQALEKREQVALQSLSGFFAILIVYFLVWAPVVKYQEDSQTFRDRQLSLVQYMRASEKEARAQGQNGRQQLTGQSLLTEVSRTAQSLGIKPNRLQPEGNDAVSVWFDAVAFNDLIALLQQIRAQQGIVVRQISIDREGPGLVRARIVLRS